MMPRHLPFLVFGGCVLFSVLHAMSQRMDAKSASPDPAHSTAAPHDASEEKPAAAADGPHAQAKGSVPGVMAKTAPAQPANGAAGLTQIKFKPPEIVAKWDNKIIGVQDPAVPGKVDPGLRGQIYLFAEQAEVSSEANGTLSIALFDRTPGLPNNNPVTLGEWNVDAATLKKFEQRDQVGICYVLYLPFASYGPEIKQISLTARYQPATGGPPLVSEGSAFSLENSAVQQTKTPAGHDRAPK